MSTPKITRLVAKLDRETIAGNVVWAMGPPSGDLTRGTDDIVSQVYEAVHKDVKLRVFEKHFKSCIDNEGGSWTTGVVLQFLNDDGTVGWETGSVPGLHDLIETIRFQTCKVNQKIDAILAA
jgi:hypothetical protein